MTCGDRFSFYDGCNSYMGCKCPPKEPYDGCGVTLLHCGNQKDNEITQAYDETVRVCCGES